MIIPRAIQNIFQLLGTISNGSQLKKFVGHHYLWLLTQKICWEPLVVVPNKFSELGALTYGAQQLKYIWNHSVILLCLKKLGLENSKLYVK